MKRRKKIRQINDLLYLLDCYNKNTTIQNLDKRENVLNELLKSNVFLRLWNEATDITITDRICVNIYKNRDKKYYLRHCYGKIYNVIPYDNKLVLEIKNKNETVNEVTFGNDIKKISNDKNTKDVYISKYLAKILYKLIDKGYILKNKYVKNNNLYLCFYNDITKDEQTLLFNLDKTIIK